MEVKLEEGVMWRCRMKGGRRAWMRMDDEVDVGMEDDDDERLVKPTLSVSKGGVNLFIRNLPFEATEEELPDLQVISEMVCDFGLTRVPVSARTVCHNTPRSRWTAPPADPGVPVTLFL